MMGESLAFGYVMGQASKTCLRRIGQRTQKLVNSGKKSLTDRDSSTSQSWFGLEQGIVLLNDPVPSGSG